MSNIRKIGKVKIIDDKLVYKKENNLNEIYNYLLSRDFKNFPELINREEDKNIYNYINDYAIDNNQKGEDIASLMASLHNKTSYNKEVKKSTFANIIENLDGYVNYLDEYYNKIMSEYESVLIPSPSEMLFITNYKKINELIYFLKEEIKKYKTLVINKTSVRVSLLHGNIRLDHIINNKEKYLISWDNANIDSPVIDFVKFYKNDWDKVNFSEILKIYLDKCKLSEDEKKLLFINICIPIKEDFVGSEFEKVIIVRKLYDYIYKCEELIRPYYTIENKKE